MDSLQKQENAVNPDAKQHAHNVDKAMHGLRIYSPGKNFSIDEAVDPFVMDIQVSPTIGMYLKSPV